VARYSSVSITVNISAMFTEDKRNEQETGGSNYLTDSSVHERQLPVCAWNQRNLKFVTLRIGGRNQIQTQTSGGKSGANGLLGRSCRNCENNVKIDPTETFYEGMDSTHGTPKRIQRRFITASRFIRFHKAENFLTCWITINFCHAKYSCIWSGMLSFNIHNILKYYRAISL
jgi:hypothetical protein